METHTDYLVTRTAPLQAKAPVPSRFSAKHARKRGISNSRPFDEISDKFRRNRTRCCSSYDEVSDVWISAYLIKSGMSILMLAA